MKQIKYLICILAVTLLIAIPTLAAEGEGDLIQEYIHVELYQDGGFAEEVSPSDQVQLFDNSLEDRLYDRLYQGLKSKETQIDIEDIGFSSTGSGKEDLTRIYVKVINDHPEFYYATQGFSTAHYTDGVYVYVKPVYNALLQAEQSVFDAAVAEALSVVDGSMSDLEKALVLHDYLVTHVAYNWEVAGGMKLDSSNPVYSAYGALVNGNAVCQGYALAYKLLLNECGISCVTVSSKQLNHMWNAVQLDGDPNWYYVDTTWDDPTNDTYGRCGHDNFLLSEDGLRATKHVSNDWSFNPSNDNSTSYESGWVFNEVDTALYRRGGGYYYIRNKKEISNDGTHLKGSTLYFSETLRETNAQEVYLFKGSNMGIFSAIWMDDKVYGLEYFQQKVVCVELDSGNAQTVWTGDTQGYNYGLLYNEQEDKVEIWSDLSDTDGTRTQKGSFEVKDYPLAWEDQPDSSSTALVGARWKDGTTLQIGVVCGADTSIPTLWVATYEGKKMTGVYEANTSGLTNGLNILELSIPSGQTTKEVRLFLLSNGSWIPCGADITPS